MDAHVNKSIRSGHFQHISNMISTSIILPLLQTPGRGSSECQSFLERLSCDFTPVSLVFCGSGLDGSCLNEIIVTFWLYTHFFKGICAWISVNSSCADGIEVDD